MRKFHFSPSPSHFGLAVLSLKPFPVRGSGERELAESGLGSEPRKRAGNWRLHELGIGNEDKTISEGRRGEC